MRLPQERGPVSRRVLDTLRRGRPLSPVALDQAPLLLDGDAQLALWLLDALHYRGFEEVPDAREWDPHLLSLRAELERRLETELRQRTGDAVSGQRGGVEDVAAQLMRIAATDEGPSVASFLQREATREEALHYLSQRAVQQLHESDPQAVLLPRLQGGAKVALAELLYDEFGAGRAEGLHQHLYAEALVAAGLSPDPSDQVDSTQPAALAAVNAMSLFALNRRLRGAAAGHFAAFEATSSVPSRKVAAGLERLGFPDAVPAYFHEHVEADAVHEQVAARDLCGSLVADEPSLHDDVLFGAASCVALEGLVAEEMLGAWSRTRCLKVAS